MTEEPLELHERIYLRDQQIKSLRREIKALKEANQNQARTIGKQEQDISILQAKLRHPVRRTSASPEAP